MTKASGSEAFQKSTIRLKTEEKEKETSSYLAS